MPTNFPTLTAFLQHLQTASEPFILKKNGQPPLWSDGELHQAFYKGNPEQYALLALVDAVTTNQRLRMLFTLLQHSRADLPPATRQTLERVTHVLLAMLHPDRVLAVFLALRRMKANHKHTARAILRYILNHPQFEDLALRRRPAVVEAIEHALGKNTARGAIKQLSTGNAGELHRGLLRHTCQAELVKTVLPFLYRAPVGQGLIAPVGEIQYTLVHENCAKKFERVQEKPTTVTATNRGEIAATLVHLYRGGYSEELQKSLELSVQAATTTLPSFAGKVALILDSSASTRGYGEREFCILSQSVALKLVLEKCCPHLQVYRVGGSGELPQPENQTDLATALVDALEGEPDLIVLVSDGYENVYPGDLDRVVATLPLLGIQTPIVFCHSKFTNKDDLSLRRPTTHLPQLEFWHQDEFPALMLDLFSRVSGPLGEQCIQDFLLRKLEFVEKELVLWTASN